MPPGTQAGTTVVAKGKSSEVQMELTIVYNYDGFLYNGSYLGGMVSMLDFSAQETYLYVIQGVSPRGPFGATFRGTPGGGGQANAAILVVAPASAQARPPDARPAGVAVRGIHLFDGPGRRWISVRVNPGEDRRCPC